MAYDIGIIVNSNGENIEAAEEKREEESMYSIKMAYREKRWRKA